MAGESKDLRFLILTVAVSPILLFPGSSGRVSVALILPLLWLWRWRTRTHPVARPPLNLSLAILLLSVLLNAFSTPDLELSTEKMAGTVLGVVLLFAVVDFLDSEKRIRLALPGFAALGGLFGFFSLAFTEWKPRYEFLADFALQVFPVRFSPTGGEAGFNPNPIGGSMALFVPILLTLCVMNMRDVGIRYPVSERIYSWFFRGALMIVLTVLVLCQSRSAWFAALVSSLFLGLIWKLRGRQRRSSVAMATLFLAIVFGGMALVFLAVRSDWFSALLFAGGSARQEVWARAIWGVQDFPLTGLGMNTFRKVVTEMYPFYGARPGVDLANAHNHFLQTALDLGLPALVAYGTVWFAVLRMLYILILRATSQWMMKLSMGIGAGLMAHLLFQVADAVPLGAKLGVFWWLAIALVTSMYLFEFPGARSQTFAEPGLALLYLLTASTVSVVLLQQFPLLAMVTVLGGSLAIAATCVPDPGKAGARVTVSSEKPPWFRLRATRVAVCIALCVLFPPTLARATRLNLKALESLRRPEKLIAEQMADSEGSAPYLRAIGNAHWRLGDYSQASKFFISSLSKEAREITVFKSILSSLRGGDLLRAHEIRNRYAFRIEPLRLFAYNSFLGVDQVSAFAIARLIMETTSPTASSLCTAGRIYGKVNKLDSIRPAFVEHLATIDIAQPIHFECSFQLGYEAFKAGDLDLALRFWDRFSEGSPDHHSPVERARACYIAYRLEALHRKATDSEATRLYTELSRKWCAGVETWYGRAAQ